MQGKYKKHKCLYTSNKKIENAKIISFEKQNKSHNRDEDKCHNRGDRPLHRKLQNIAKWNLKLYTEIYRVQA